MFSFAAEFEHGVSLWDCRIDNLVDLHRIILFQIHAAF